MEERCFYESECFYVKETAYVKQTKMKKSWPLTATLLEGKKIIHVCDFISKKPWC